MLACPLEVDPILWQRWINLEREKDNRRQAMKEAKELKGKRRPTGGKLSVSGPTAEKADAATGLTPRF